VKWEDQTTRIIWFAARLVFATRHFKTFHSKGQQTNKWYKAVLGCCVDLERRNMAAIDETVTSTVKIKF